MKSHNKSNILVERVRGFTIAELLVVMLLTTVTIGVGYLVYTITFRQFLKYKENESQLVRQYTLHSCLSRDIRTADEFTRTTDGIEFKSTLHNVMYKIGDDLIIREGLSSDTFVTKEVSCRVYLKRKECVSAGELADEIELTYTFDEEDIHVNLHKDYGCKQELMQDRENY